VLRCIFKELGRLWMDVWLVKN